uniref:Uncharacterized protein n=1 Tax=mine drainage metagenome TaxID=410659 RepID=E6QRX5_9ZZZZ
MHLLAHCFALIKDEVELETLLKRTTKIHESLLPEPRQSALTGERRTKLLTQQ